MTQKKKSNWLIYTLIGAVLSIGVVAFITSKNRNKGEEVEVEKVEKRTIRETVAASGKVFPVTEVKISSDVSGEIVALLVEEGDSVKSGQLLAQIDPDAYESQVERGMAQVNSAKANAANARSQIENFKAQRAQIMANLKNARKMHERNMQLHKEGVISDADLEASEASRNALEANLESIEANIRASEQSANAAEYSIKSAEATLKELKTVLRRTDIFAPMSGIVSRLNVEQGERVVGTIQMAGTEMMRIADLSKMEVQVDVSENDIPRVTMGDDVDIEVDAYLNRTFKGKVTEIAHSASNMATSGISTSLNTDQVTNFVVTINIDPASYNDLVTEKSPFPFRPGMSASVEIEAQIIENTLSVPIQAVTTREFDKNGKPKDRVKKRGEKDNQEEEEDNDGLAKTVSNKGNGHEEEIREVVFVVNEDKTVSIREVTTGIQDDSYIQVVSGLEDGQTIVTGPYSAVSRNLKDGEDITIKKGE
ncbi:MAG: efflux RND transporter periplasmic adaptor subunit [Saprospiraceae bacterium]|nr:efflux RND transporter periplasmic adaptor subunit [Saprospiraceae bacterium]